MCPGAEAPISRMRKRVVSSALRTVRGRPISLLKLAAGAIVGAWAARIWRVRSLVVVLPTLPVMAATVSARPCSAARSRRSARWARARRPSASTVSDTVMRLSEPGASPASARAERTPSRSCTRMATAPARAAAGTNWCPSSCSPAMATKRPPGATFLESVKTPVTVVARTESAVPCAA